MPRDGIADRVHRPRRKGLGRRMDEGLARLRRRRQIHAGLRLRPPGRHASRRKPEPERPGADADHGRRLGRRSPCAGRRREDRHAVRDRRPLLWRAGRPALCDDLPRRRRRHGAGRCPLRVPAVGRDARGVGLAEDDSRRRPHRDPQGLPRHRAGGCGPELRSDARRAAAPADAARRAERRRPVGPAGPGLHRRRHARPRHARPTSATSPTGRRRWRMRRSPRSCPARST